MDNEDRAGSPADPPSNAFEPVPGCWICTAIDTVARAAWREEGGLTLRDWLSVTASGMHHRMRDHGPDPAAGARCRR
ncbi:hypothetical protein AB0N14_36055 [Streptomyces sp. NPDC051104]|uniref:hypothetical protein n=1 Tax=Streptomyces sp. NPDC051104 TaxID=3155044 RepID=UPI003417A0B4